jgi:GTPase
MTELNHNKERVIVIGLAHKYNPLYAVQDSLEELKVLCESAGAEVLFSVIQERTSRDPAYYIGKGKAEELHLLSEEIGADSAVFDEPLTATQRHNLENIFQIKILDRTQIILDIFAQRARSKEGKLQVELAQLKYTASRLIGKGTQLSRLGGGIGTRGPGEQKLESDKRRIRKRIQTINKELDTIRKYRSQQRQLRNDNEICTFSLVGYTNAGKSTLFNLLTSHHSAASSTLFTTLDPLIRKVVLPHTATILLSDTVGFIHKLPQELLTAFKATLEEVVFSSALLHIIDASSPHMNEHIDSVNKILEEILVQDKHKILVFNKMDLPEAQQKQSMLQNAYPDALFISAKNHENIDSLHKRLETIALNEWLLLHIIIPLSAMDMLHHIYEKGLVRHRKNMQNSVELDILASPQLFNFLKKDNRLSVQSAVKENHQAKIERMNL